VNGEAAFRFGLANADRNTDGTIVEKSLVEIVARAIDFDPEEQRLGLARRVVSARKKPGMTAPAGKVALPGLGLREYEPERLVADDGGNLIENSRATVQHKKAEARRSASNADRAVERAEQDQAEAELIDAWAKEQRQAGRDERELVFGACVSELGLLDDGEAQA
jgi:hypothetical protein